MTGKDKKDKGEMHIKGKTAEDDADANSNANGPGGVDDGFNSTLSSLLERSQNEDGDDVRKSDTTWLAGNKKLQLLKSSHTRNK